MTFLTAKEFSIDLDGLAEDDLLQMLAEAWIPNARISLDTADGSESVFWKARAMEISNDKKEAIILVETIHGERWLRIYETNGTFHASLAGKTFWSRRLTLTNLQDWENSHFCFKGEHVVQIEF